MNGVWRGRNKGEVRKEGREGGRKEKVNFLNLTTANCILFQKKDTKYLANTPNSLKTPQFSTDRATNLVSINPL